MADSILPGGCGGMNDGEGVLEWEPVPYEVAILHVAGYVESNWYRRNASMHRPAVRPSITHKRDP